MLSRRGLLAGSAAFVAVPAVAGERIECDPFPDVRVEMIDGKIKQFVYDDMRWVEIAVAPTDPHPTLADIIARRALLA
jgi:hypothetical protein